MADIELYKILFLDSLKAGLFFTVDYEYIIWIISSFKKLNDLQAIGIAILGYCISILFNYLFGFSLYKIYDRYVNEITYQKYKNAKQYIQKYIFIFILLTAINGFGKTLFVFLGFLNFNMFFVLITGIIVKSIYYLYNIY